jgi:hypothetical protein
MEAVLSETSMEFCEAPEDDTHVVSAVEMFSSVKFILLRHASLSTRLHGVTSQNTTIFKASDVENLRCGLFHCEVVQKTDVFSWNSRRGNLDIAGSSKRIPLRDLELNKSRIMRDLCAVMYCWDVQVFAAYPETY